MKMKIKSMIKRVYADYDDTGYTLYYSGVLRFVPLAVTGLFFVATIMLCAFGPLKWDISSPGRLYGFLMLCCAALTGGYCLAVFKGKTTGKPLHLNINNILVSCCILYFILYIPIVYATTGSWYPDVIRGIVDTGSAYRETKAWALTASQLPVYIKILVSPALLMITPVTLFFMPKLKHSGRICGILVIILNLSLSIAQGVNKSVADLASQLVLLLIIMLFIKQPKGKAVRNRLFYVGMIVLICGLFLAYYANGMNNRVEKDIADTQQSDEVSDEDTKNTMTAYSTFNAADNHNEHILNRILPDSIKPIITFLISYMTHGYQGLSYALEEDFTTSYGLGFSDFLRRNALRFFGNEQTVYRRTYMGKIEESRNWNTGATWSSFFIFPASDISFPGTVLLVLLIGFLFGLSWKDALTTRNPFAITVFFGFCIMVFYFCANNQMFQSGENCVGFSVMIAVWLVLRRILFYKQKKTKNLITTNEEE